ncbi:threonine dehydratase, partial [Bradyrhizobium sp. RT9b]
VLEIVIALLLGLPLGPAAIPFVKQGGLQWRDTIGVSSIHLKVEGHRLSLGSFNALGGSYAVIRVVFEEASRRFARDVDVSELRTPEVRAVAAGMTVSCAMDGNHGRSVAYGGPTCRCTMRHFRSFGRE